MLKITTGIIILLSLSSIYAETFVDSVLNQSIATEIYWKDRKAMVKRVTTLDTAEQREIFVELAKVSIKDRADAIGYLFKLNDPIAFDLLSEYKENLYKGGWELIAQYLRRNEWRLAEINDSLYSYLVTSKNEEMAQGIFSHFSYRALYADLDRLWEIRDEVSNLHHKKAISAYQVDFKSPQTDQRVIETLRNPFVSYYATGAVIRSMVLSNRYDFIDELKLLQIKLKAESDPLKKEIALEILSDMDYVLRKLEKAKAERRKIGKPLDWGLDFPTKESEEEERKKKQAQEEAAAKEKKSPATGINLDWGLDK